MANVDVLRQRFVEHAGGNLEETLPELGAVGAARFLTENGVQAPEPRVQDFFDAQGWDSEFAASWSDVRLLAVALGVPDSRALSPDADVELTVASRRILRPMLVDRAATPTWS